MADYYVDARNWSYALGEDPTPYLIVCDAVPCDRTRKVAAKSRAQGRHVIGGREHVVSSLTLVDPSATEADFVVQLHLKINSGRFVDRSGHTIRRTGPQTMVVNLHLAWNEKMWRVTGDYLAKP